MSTATEAQATRKSGGAALDMDSVLSATEQAMANRPDLIQMKMEHESIMAECRTRPRDMKAIMAEIEEQFQLCPEFATQAIYAKPIGTVFAVVCECGNRYEVGARWDRQARDHRPRDEACERCEKWAPKVCRKTVKKARNLSVRTAEALAEVYGFNRVHCAVNPIDGSTVKVTASFFDYQKLRSWIAESIVSKSYTTKWKSVQVMDDDRFYGTVLKAQASKCIREAILRCVPPAIKMRVFAIAEKIAGQALKEDEIDKIVAAFGEKGVSLERLEHHVGRTRREGWTKADRLELLEAWNALKENEATVEELFGDLDDSPAAPSAVPQSGATMEDLAGQQKPQEGTDDGSPQEETAAETAEADQQAAGSGQQAVDSQPAAPGEDDQPGEPGAPAEAEGRTADFAGFTAAVQEALTVEEVDQLLIDAEGSLSAEELSALRTTAKNRKIGLSFASGGRKRGKGKTSGKG